MSAGSEFVYAVRKAVLEVRNQMPGRMVRGSNVLWNHAMQILKGNGGGRRYRIPGTGRFYTASAPGEVPAVRTASFRRSWKQIPYSTGREYHCAVVSNMTVSNGALLGDYLENGTPGGKMAPRPHQEKILQKALPEVKKIFKEPYF